MAKTLESILSTNRNILLDLCNDPDCFDELHDKVQEIYFAYCDHENSSEIFSDLLKDDVPDDIKELLLSEFSSDEAKIVDKKLISRIRHNISKGDHSLAFGASYCLLVCTDLKWEEIPELQGGYIYSGLKSRMLARIRKRFEKEGR